MALVDLERPAAGDPEGLLILHHGRGSDERDLIDLGDVLDPERRWHVVTPRAPLTLRGFGGYHWYVVPRVGYPEPETFRRGYAELGAFHDELWARTGLRPEQTVLGGFSQGSAMSYALGLAGDRPPPSGLLIFSGFVPSVEGWSADLASRPGLPAFVAHGRADPVMEITLARRSRDLLIDGGATVEYHESDAGHTIDPVHLGAARAWLAQRVALSATAARP